MNTSLSSGGDDSFIPPNRLHAGAAGLGGLTGTQPLAAVPPCNTDSSSVAVAVCTETCLQLLH